MSPKQQRLARLYQRKSRGDRRSYKTDAENLGLLLLWEAEVLSEGQVAKALDIDRVTLRMMREGAMAEALKLAEALVPAPDLTRPRSNTPNVKLTGTGLIGWVRPASENWRLVMSMKIVAWLCEMAQEDGTTRTQIVEQDPAGLRWNDEGEPSPYRTTPLIASPSGWRFERDGMRRIIVHMPDGGGCVVDNVANDQRMIPEEVLFALCKALGANVGVEAPDTAPRR